MQKISSLISIIVASLDMNGRGNAAQGLQQQPTRPAKILGLATETVLSEWGDRYRVSLNREFKGKSVRKGFAPVPNPVLPPQL
tara:strand:+ start:636 stop:884 length:249 start_codon:yes stop_codon:yes gene_type:complete